MITLSAGCYFFNGFFPLFILDVTEEHADIYGGMLQQT
jgi:hypothetical protein